MTLDPELERGVAPDGCPVRVYLMVPGHEEAAIIDAAIPSRTAILELGCGVGRMSRHLAPQGHAITGVDKTTGTSRRSRRSTSTTRGSRRWPRPPV